MTTPQNAAYKPGIQKRECSMAKKAKRRGRPPGSKNKVQKANGVRAPKGIAKSFAKMEVSQLRGLIGDLESLLAQKINQQKSILEAHLAELQGYVSQKAAGVVRTVMQVPKVDGRSGKRAKAQPKYQSKKDKSLKWSGRGMTPVWMRDEMKGTKLTKDAFLIK
jgi:DNA-binding protein H-NS